MDKGQQIHQITVNRLVELVKRTKCTACRAACTMSGICLLKLGLRMMPLNHPYQRSFMSYFLDLTEPLSLTWISCISCIWNFRFFRISLHYTLKFLHRLWIYCYSYKLYDSKSLYSLQFTRNCAVININSSNSIVMHYVNVSYTCLDDRLIYIRKLSSFFWLHFKINAVVILSAAANMIDGIMVSFLILMI